MIRVVLDTSVLISAVFARESLPRQTVRWVSDRGVFLRSVETESEFFRTVERPKFARLIDPAFIDFLRMFFDRAEMVSGVPPVKVCRDPDDDKFLALALLRDKPMPL